MLSICQRIQKQLMDNNKTVTTKLTKTIKIKMLLMKMKLCAIEKENEVVD